MWQLIRRKSTSFIAGFPMRMLLETIVQGFKQDFDIAVIYSCSSICPALLTHMFIGVNLQVYHVYGFL